MRRIGVSCGNRILIKVIFEYSDGELTHASLVGFGGGGNLGFQIGGKVKTKENIFLFLRGFGCWFGGGGCFGGCHVEMVKMGLDSCTSVYHLQGDFKVFLLGILFSGIGVFR